MISRVGELYEKWFMVFNDSLLPQLISQTAPKWYNHDRDLAQGDVVYFRKSEGPIKGPWTMGMVDSVLKFRDLLIREVRERYHNADQTAPHFTDRAVRSLVRLFNMDKLDWQHDLVRIAKIYQDTGLSCEIPDMKTFASVAQCLLEMDQHVLPCACCCTAHHKYCPQTTYPTSFKVQTEMMPGQTTTTSMPLMYFPEEDAVLDCAGHHLDMEANQDGFLSAALQLGASMEI